MPYPLMHLLQKARNIVLRRGFNHDNQGRCSFVNVLGVPSGRAWCGGRNRGKSVARNGGPDAAPGASASAKLDVTEAGTYHVSVVLTKAVDYGIVSIRINDRLVAEDVNLYQAVEDGVSVFTLDLGHVELAGGDNRIKIDMVASYPDTIKRHMFGLDQVIFTKNSRLV